MVRDLAYDRQRFRVFIAGTQVTQITRLDAKPGELENIPLDSPLGKKVLRLAQGLLSKNSS